MKVASASRMVGAVAFFMSGFWARVTPVECDPDDFETGRFVVNGQMRRGRG